MRFTNDRKERIAMMVAEGLNNREIAENIYISESAVKKHITTLFHRYGVDNRIQLAVAITKKMSS